MEHGRPLYVNDSAPPDPVHRNLERLTSLQCTDPGMFVLATHSFVEGWIRDHFGLGMDEISFTSLMNIFTDEVKKQKNCYLPEIPAMNAMITAHIDVNSVRHRFAELDKSAAEMATQHLDRFCSLANIGSPEQLGTIRRHLSHWDERKATGALIEELKAIKNISARYNEEKRSLIARIAEMGEAVKYIEQLKSKLAQQDRTIEELKARNEVKSEKADTERRERARIAEELKTAQIELKAYEKEQKYIALMRRLTAYTRTRADYERSIVHLTPEQSGVLGQIRLNSDFLVKGAAGTGKTLVLLKAIEKAKGGGKVASLGFEELQGSVALLTYNTTLAKYDRYIASILSPEHGADRIMTADAFLRERLTAIESGASIDYNNLLQDLAKHHCPEGMTPKELCDEAEIIVWGNDLSFEDYISNGFERRGMKKALQPHDRAKVWAACEAMAAEMESRHRYSKSYSRIKLLRASKEAQGDPRLKVVDYVFIDEAQDLTAADLKTLKACARRSVILAGDADQSIYQPGFSFRQAGIDVAGRVRILKTNFRNTLPVHSLAEAYRAGKPSQDPESQPAAFREGPLPELFSSEDLDSLIDLLIARVQFFKDYLEYDPENICILAPQNDEVNLVIERLLVEGFAAENPKEKDFDFTKEGTVRVATCHSAKGLDFPVVFLLLNRKPYAGSSYNDAVEDIMTRNLIYVGMTRAMEHLNIFTLENPGSPAIADLVSCVDAQKK